MNIIMRELRAHMKSLIIWSVSIIALIAMMMSEFSAYYNNPEMADILDAMPQSLLDAFSIAGANLTTVSGYVSMASVYFYILLSIYAALLGSSIISKEERDKTAEFFVTLPISRIKIISTKLISAIILCISVNIVTMLAIYGTTVQYDRGEGFNKFMFLMMLAIFIIQMIFMSVGMLLAAVMRRYKLSGRYSMSLLFGLYVVSVITALSDKLENLKYITPFKYFEASYILHEGNLEAKYVLISLVIISVAIASIYIVYPKRDLYI
ncbi:ABC transporter permease subunit [Clostridium sp. DL1XJH146]